MRTQKRFSFRRGLTAKLIGMSLLVGLLIWVLAQGYENRTLQAAFEDHMREMLDDQARSDRLDFDQFGKRFLQVAQLMVGQQRFQQHFSAYSALSPAPPPRNFTSPPDWLLGRSALRSLAVPRCALVFNARRALLESYCHDQLSLPPQLIHPNEMLLQKSLDQTHMTLLEGTPYMLTAAATEVAGERLLLLLALPIDEYLLLSLNLDHDRLMALVSLNEREILISSNRQLIPVGTPLAELEKTYVISGRSFHDKGGAEMVISLNSFLPRAELNQMKEAFVNNSRWQRTMATLVVLFGPIPIIVWAASRIRRLTDRVRSFSSETLRSDQLVEQSGDELCVLDENISLLMNEVLDSHQLIRSETLNEAQLKNTLEQQRQQLELLLLITEVLNVGVLSENPQLKAENPLMAQWAEKFGGLEPFRTEAGKPERRNLADPQGNEHTFELQAMCFSAGENVVLVSDLTAQLQAETEKERLQAELLQAQKMESVGRLAGGVAHDFNNILTAIGGNLHLMGRKVAADDPLRKYMGVIDDASRKGAELTRQLLGFSRKQLIAPKPLILNQTIEQLLQMLRRLIGENIEIETSLQIGLWPVVIDGTQVEQVIMNLAVNARDAMPEGGRLLIETCNVELSEDYARKHLGVTAGEYVCLCVSDTGQGISPDDQKHIFEPFYTTKAKGEGTGLGLSMVYGIVKQNNGNIYVYSEPDEGTTFKIYLPRSLQVVAEPPSEPSSAEIPRGSETILLVEDDDGVRSFVVAVLSELGYTVLEAADGEEAIRSFEKYHGKIHLLLTDVVLPKMNGQKIAAELSRRSEDLQVLYMSGYTQNAIVNQGVLAEGIHFLPKPLDLENLAQAVRRVLDPQVLS